MKKLLSLIVLMGVSGLAKAAPVTYNVGGFANISGDASYIVEGTLVMDDTNLFSAFNLNYNLLSLDLDISNGTTTYTLSADNGFMTYFRPSITDTEYFADGWFINTDLGTIYDTSQEPTSMPVGGEALPDTLVFGLSSFDTPIYFDSDSAMNYLYFESTVVPVPGAVWLFGSGLIGLISVARSRCQHHRVS